MDMCWWRGVAVWPAGRRREVVAGWAARRRRRWRPCGFRLGAAGGTAADTWRHVSAARASVVQEPRQSQAVAVQSASYGTSARQERVGGTCGADQLSACFWILHERGRRQAPAGLHGLTMTTMRGGESACMASSSQSRSGFRLSVGGPYMMLRPPPVIWRAIRWLKYKGVKSTTESLASVRVSTTFTNAWFAPDVTITSTCTSTRSAKFLRRRYDILKAGSDTSEALHDMAL